MTPLAELAIISAGYILAGYWLALIVDRWTR